MAVKFNEYSNECLAKYADQISEDFQSTFTILNENTLANMLGFEGDFENLSKIIKKYLPDHITIYKKTNQLKGDYDIYIIRSISCDDPIADVLLSES